jgi:hypothetical protein
MGPTVTHTWRLQFVIKVSARSFLRLTCTYGTLQHLTCGTRRLTCHVYLWDCSPSPSDLWDPMACVSRVPVGPSDLWDPTPHVSRVPVGPFSISIWPVGPHDLRATCTFCAAGVQYIQKKTSMPGSRTRDPEEGMHDLYHCARCLVVLTCLWSCYSIIFSMWILYRLTYIRYFPFKWKQICAR